MDPLQSLVGLYAGTTVFLSLGFSLFLFLGYRLAPIQQHRLLLIVGLAFAVSATVEFLDVYGALQPLVSLIGAALPLGIVIRQSAMIVASVVLFWYSYTTYYFILKSSPEKEAS